MHRQVKAEIPGVLERVLNIWIGTETGVGKRLRLKRAEAFRKGPHFGRPSEAKEKDRYPAPTGSGAKKQPPIASRTCKVWRQHSVDRPKQSWTLASGSQRPLGSLPLSTQKLFSF